MLSNEASARLCSHVARLNNRLPAIVDDAVNALAPAFPNVRDCIPSGTRQQRFEVLTGLAYVCKNIANVSRIDSWLEMMGEEALCHGFDCDAARAATTWAIVDAVRRHAGDDWSSELDRDWQTFAAMVCTGLARGAQRLGSIGANAANPTNPIRIAA